MPKRVVHFVPDPADPAAPPRAVVMEKVGFWDRLIPPPAPANHAPRALPVPAATPTPSAATGTAAPTTTLATPPPLTPFPATYTALPRAERKAWDSRRAAEIRSWKAWERACAAAAKAEAKRKAGEEKEKARKKREEEKIAQRNAKLQARLGYKPLPQLIPHVPGGTTVAPAPAPPAAASSAAPSRAWQSQPTSWMLLPTLEEFGVRRPFDAPGRPEGLAPGRGVVDIGGVEWPRMSRTMTYDMSVEERVHMGQVGHTWAPASGWYKD